MIYRLYKENRTRFTPPMITSLEKDSIFVFGANTHGKHLGGAAKIAVQKFGAIMGQGVGLQGNTYAIPTLDGNFEKLSLSVINRYVEDFIKFAKVNTQYTFYVTELGCGIAGFTIGQIAPMFERAVEVDNIILPEKFVNELGE